MDTHRQKREHPGGGLVGRLDGKVAFITGVARGQGRSHAVRLAEEGADIIGIDSLTDVDSTSYAMATQEDLDETTVLVEKTGRRAILSRADVRDREALQKAVTSAVAEFGRLDIVCGNAGIMPVGRPLWEISPQQWQDVIDTNLTGVFNTLAVTVPAIRAAGNGGSIILTASAAALRFSQNLGDYSATKAGVVALAKTLANEIGAEGIRVNAICPGTVGTPMVMANEQLFKLFRPDLENPTLQDCEPVFKTLAPMGRPWLAAEDVSNMVVFLASDEASSVTGTAMVIDQGTVS
jgi:(+)-trans-carveol dehydrogenase